MIRFSTLSFSSFSLKSLSFTLIYLLVLNFTVNAQTVVEENGFLRVSGNKIINKNEEPVSFAGMSLFWSNFGWGGEKYYNAEVVSFLKENWDITIIRAAMGVEDDGGYLQNKEREKNKVITVVDAAINEGIYVIIDWHSHHAENHQDEAVAFFTEMAELYGDKPNVIFEIYNEPTDVSWSTVIKPYAEAVIEAIRTAGSENLIVVGTPNYSQKVNVAALDPITTYDNIAYTLHFYAASHKQSLRNSAQSALDNNIALMVTEWGSVQYTGNGPVDKASVNEWMKFLKDNHISHLNWSLNDKNETASALKPGASASANWTTSNYTESGLLVKNIIENWNKIEEEEIPEEEETITNIDDVSDRSLSINIYPIPFSNELNIDFKEFRKIQSVEIFDVNGKVIIKLSKEHLRENHRLGINHPGNFFILKIIESDKTYSRSLIRK